MSVFFFLTIPPWSLSVWKKASVKETIELLRKSNWREEWLEGKLRGRSFQTRVLFPSTVYSLSLCTSLAIIYLGISVFDLGKLHSRIFPWVVEHSTNQSVSVCILIPYRLSEIEMAQKGWRFPIYLLPPHFKTCDIRYSWQNRIKTKWVFDGKFLIWIFSISSRVHSINWQWWREICMRWFYIYKKTHSRRNNDNVVESNINFRHKWHRIQSRELLTVFANALHESTNGQFYIQLSIQYSTKVSFFLLTPCTIVADKWRHHMRDLWRTQKKRKLTKGHSLGCWFAAKR